MSSSSSTSRNQLQVTHVQSQEGVKADGYYKNLLYSLKQKLDAKEELFEMNNLRRRIAEVEFLLSKEQYKVAKSVKEVHDARKAIGRYRMIVALFFACLALCILKLGGDCS
uniref:Uncharacterized protein n=1 Tax=Lactuca sativa TaxID=4236 RepID=A0A9R1W1A3_LACSA|nr:hypothetical protein LSAT_V11C300132950 [Lactuca sativa]